MKFMAEEKKAAPKAVEKPVAKPAEKSVETKSGDNTNLILCWIFAPITSLIWMNDADAKLQRVAKMTLYFTGVMLALEIIIIPLLGIIPFVQLIVCLIGPATWLVHVLVIVMGAIKAGKGEVYEIPVVKDWVK